MRPGETIATFDVGLALRGKSGKFEITSPTGEIYDVTCKPNSLSSLEWSSDGTDNSPFLIRRVAEHASQAETRAMTAGKLEEESQTASSPLPFVVEHGVDEGDASNAGDLELVYLEDDSRTGQPLACVCLKSELRFEAKSLMTTRCTTFNELDSEIRRLQAQLDEIRLRAKKMFYKTQVVAASA